MSVALFLACCRCGFTPHTLWRWVYVENRAYCCQDCLPKTRKRFTGGTIDEMRREDTRYWNINPPSI